MRVCVCACVPPKHPAVRSIGTRNTKCGHIFCLLCCAVCCCCCGCITPSSKLFARSHGTPAAALQGMPFLTATNGALGVCVSVRLCHPEETQSGRFQPALSLNLESTRAVHKTAQQQRYYRSEPHIEADMLIYITWDFKSNHIPKGEPCSTYCL